MNRASILYYFILPLCLLFASGNSMFGQVLEMNELSTDSTQSILKALESDLPLGNISISQDNRLDSLLRKHISYNDSVGIQGWKILIYHGRDIKKAQDAGALFSSAFPDLNMNTVVDYQAPDFKTLVGAFRTREEAYRIHQQILSEFEFSYLVHSTLKSGELK